MDQRSWIMDQGSRILDLGPLFWHERPSWKGYRREIKTIRIYYQRSIILYRFHKDPIKYQASWTLFWHEWPFWTGSGRDIKTARYYNRFPISFYRFSFRGQSRLKIITLDENKDYIRICIE